MLRRTTGAEHAPGNDDEAAVAASQILLRRIVGFVRLLAARVPVLARNSRG